MSIAAIIAAGGSSRRFGEQDKLAQDLGGRSVLQRSVELFAKHEAFTSIIVVGPHDETAHDQFVLRFGDALGLMGASIVRGGQTHRWESVQAGLAAVDDSCERVAIHDGARPITPREVIDRVVDAGEQYDAVVPGIAVTDTLRRVSDETLGATADPLDAILGDAGKVNQGFRQSAGTVSREGLVAIQTPQMFALPLIRRAYEQAEMSSTDDAELIERLGEPVVIVEGDPRNLKITTPTDLHVARTLLDERGEAAKRARTAFDAL